MDFTNLDYLKTGNAKQQGIYDLLMGNQILDALAPFNPILVGTFPINSDLDIICCWSDKAAFISTISKQFGQQAAFSLHETRFNAMDTVVANFTIGNYPIEIFGQPVPIREQNAYRHMVIENDILNQRGKTFRQQIIALKRQGFKTEPAFAQLLGLKGDPYQELLRYTM